MPTVHWSRHFFSSPHAFQCQRTPCFFFFRDQSAKAARAPQARHRKKKGARASLAVRIGRRQQSKEKEDHGIAEKKVHGRKGRGKRWAGRKKKTGVAGGPDRRDDPSTRPTAQKGAPSFCFLRLPVHRLARSVVGSDVATKGNEKKRLGRHLGKGHRFAAGASLSTKATRKERDRERPAHEEKKRTKEKGSPAQQTAGGVDCAHARRKSSLVFEPVAE